MSPQRSSAASRSPKKGPIIRDAADLRDLLYRPSLSLLPEAFLCAALNPANTLLDGVLKIRDQGDRPSCIGEALAGLIDIQRIEKFHKSGDVSEITTKVQPASGPMLHAMALEIEGSASAAGTDEIYSLRSGLKGFYNTGVCTEDLWNATTKSGSRPHFDKATVAAMREARNVTLGSYFRVRSFINDYHSALFEAGALYVSAELHDGWHYPPDGIINRCDKTEKFSGGHAFVIVGYDQDGFLVLNSWGRGWGGYAFAGKEKLQGIALWTYEDWARSVLDAWVLRLAVPTPGAFLHTMEQQGASAFGADQPALGAPSTRRQTVLGRYIHLEEGRHVSNGPYPSSRQSLETTLQYLETGDKAGGKDKFDDICLVLHGDPTAVEGVMARLAQGIAEDKRDRLHRFALVWINGLLCDAAAALQPLFDKARAVAEGRQQDADRRIELSVGPLGRALWRDVKRIAAMSGGPKGEATDALAKISVLSAQHSKRLHIVTEGAGSLLLAELLRTEGERQPDGYALSDILASLTLISPLNTKPDFDEKIGPFLEEWAHKRGLRAFILMPDSVFEERLCVGAYSGSWADLIQNALEEGEERTIIGSPNFGHKLRGRPKIIRLPPPTKRAGTFNFLDVLQHPAAAAHIRDSIMQIRQDNRQSQGEIPS